MTEDQYHRILGDLLWERADTVIWLDLPRRTVMWRVVRRSVLRAVTDGRLGECWVPPETRCDAYASSGELVLRGTIARDRSATSTQSPPSCPLKVLLRHWRSSRSGVLIDLHRFFDHGT